jgi:uncharacterized protein (TIGR03118 family)
MKHEAAIAARWLRLIAFSTLGAVLAACGGGGGGYSGSGSGSGNPTPTASLAVNPQTVTLGQSATLTWSSNQGTSCDASGGWTGTQPATGTSDVTPTATGTVTYTLTCSGAGYSGTSIGSATLTIGAASAYTPTSLVEDLAGGTARTTDPLLVNPWGIAYGPTTGIWVANNHSETSTIYNGNGRPSPLVVHFAPGAAAAPFDATGIVFNGTTDFAVSAANLSGPAVFIFDGEGGMIGGWSPTVDASHEITMYTATDGAVYKGLAIANNGTGNFLYAADFANGKIDVLNATFAKQASTATSFAFADPTLPAGYGPFGIQAIKKGGTTKIYVSYAKHDAAAPADDAPGPGLGLVNVFDTNGNLLTHLVAAGGKLNAPWGLTLAPSDFGTFSNALLVGNFGDGTIQGYDPDTGRYLGAVGDGAGTAFAVSGLWGIAFGNDAANQPHATLFFAAGTNGEVNGRYGRIDLGTVPPALGDPPVLTLIVPQGDLSGTVTLQANQQNLVAIAKVQFYLNGSTLIGTATADPFTVQWDTTAVTNGSAKLRAVATDVNGNVGSSAVLTVSVANVAAATTLTQVQQNVFTPRCSGCHNGSQPAGGQLPGSMDLRSGNSFANLVNVASIEQPTLMRVKPGEPDNSYVIHKIESTAGIAGARMPFGGPFLDQATIDQVRSWVASGAQNN